ncbi:MAG: 4Fe-4S dicluster domain-containing protein, partial [Thermomicrobiales bacterium]
MTRLGMVLNLDRCIGCWACAVACKMENSVGEGLWWQKVQTIGGAAIDTSEGVFPDVQKHYQPRNCFHCAEPPCLPVCPTHAIVKRADGIVEIVEDLCIGCGKCAPACPFDAIELNIVAPVLPKGLEVGHGAFEVTPRVAGVVEKCSFCSHRVDAGLEPACVEACPTQVITFGDVEDSESAVSGARAAP